MPEWRIKRCRLLAGYQDFSYFYDEFNGEADYDALYREISSRFTSHKLPGKIVADLGCGTGELSLRLAKEGYDVISVDASEEMLSIFSEKLQEEGQQGVLLLKQDLTELDLYGTIHGAICTFDTLNHIGPVAQMEQVISRVGLFMEKGGLFLFDVNSPYKHQQVLADETFTIEDEDAICIWRNHLEAEQRRTHIEIDISYRDDPEHYQESFYEYYCEPQELLEACQRHGFQVLEILDGENFVQPKTNCQRFLFVAEKVIQCQS